MGAVHDPVDALAQDLAGINDTDSRRAVFLRHAESFGVTRYAYLNTTCPRDPFHVETNYPTAWVERYLERNYMVVDAVSLEAARSPVPFRWRDALARPQYGANSQRVFEEAADFSIRDGFTVPIHSGAGLSIISLVVEDPALFQPSSAARRHMLHLLAMHFHLACDRALNEEVAPPLPRLTPREREVLLWTAKGKTGWEIAQILNLAERTVVYHIENARTKLGASSRAQAVVAAMTLGLIRP